MAHGYTAVALLLLVNALIAVSFKGMLHHTLVAACLAVAWIPVSIVAAQPQADSSPRVLFSMTGRHSDVVHRGYELVRDSERFDAIWTEHAGDSVERAAQGWPMPPSPNFDTVSVVFVFGGRSLNSNGFTFDSLQRIDGALRLRFDAITYQTMSFDGPDHGDAVTPWAMLVLDKVTGPLILEENVQGLIGGEPIWKARACFQADGTGAAGPLSPSELLDSAPEGQRVALSVPVESLTYCRHDANPAQFSWQGLTAVVTNERGNEHTILAPVAESLHARTEIDPDIGSIDHLRTDDGTTIAIACNADHQQGRTERVLLVGRWTVERGRSLLYIDAITRLDRP